MKIIDHLLLNLNVNGTALLVRNGDVPVYVSYGQADLGIVG